MSIDRAGGDLVVSTRYLNRLLEHEAGDLTATVEAGMRLSTLNERLAEHGQMLALDPPGDPTVGAVVAGDLFGPRAHRYGRARDLVLGVTVVLGDGTVANAGGKVVKNVAGYDLAKLFCGSHGRLGLIGAREPAPPPPSRGEPHSRHPRGSAGRGAEPRAGIAPFDPRPERRRSRLERRRVRPSPSSSRAARRRRRPSWRRAAPSWAAQRTEESGTRSPPASWNHVRAGHSPRASFGLRLGSCPQPSFGSAPPATPTCPCPTSSRGRRSPSA